MTYFNIILPQLIEISQNFLPLGPPREMKITNTNYVPLIVVPCILYEFINYYQQMHYIVIKIIQTTVFYVIIRAPTCFDPPGSSSGSSEGPY